MGTGTRLSTLQWESNLILEFDVCYQVMLKGQVSS